jgi:copper chaperone
MNTLKFKTNIKCNGCKAKVTPFLNQEKAIIRWDVDLNNPDRILTVEGDDITEEMIENALKKAGYQAVKIQS